MSIYDEFDIKIFQDQCIQKINEIQSKGKRVIICGGSNLYIDAVIKGYHLDKASSRNDTTYFDNWNYDDIYKYVLEHDEKEALKINYNNKKRIIRAAQIIYITKQRKSVQDTQKNSYVYDCFIIETTRDRNLLYQLINERVDKMLSNKWIEEVRELWKKDPQIVNLQALKAIGYPQIIEYLQTGQDIDVEKIKQITRNLAKKQLTWCRTKYLNKHIFNVDTNNYQELLEQILAWLR